MQIVVFTIKEHQIQNIGIPALNRQAGNASDLL